MSRSIPVISQAGGSDRFESLTLIPLTGHVVGGKGRRICCEFSAPRPRAIARVAIGCALTMFLLTGCYKRSVLLQSEGHVTTPAANPTLADIPPIARSANFLPEPQPSIKLPTYSVTVDKVEVKELLMALVRDTKQNIDINPELTGVVSLHVVNETLPGILERISKQIPLRYRQTGNSIEVGPDTPYTKVYQINYVNMTRNSATGTAVSGDIGTAGATDSVTLVKTLTINDFWKDLEASLKKILLSSQMQNAQARAERISMFRMQYEMDIQNTRAAPAAALGAQRPLSSGEGPFGSGVGGGTSASASAGAAAVASAKVDDVIVNPATGTVTVSATEAQHNLIQTYLVQVQGMSKRQVLIEATIAEVTLSDQYQGGVDWSRVALSGGLSLQQSLLAGNLGSPPNFVVGYTTPTTYNPNSTLGNITAAIKLLNQFGNTRVLSSPKLMAVNNQTAILKATDTIVYFTITVTPAIIVAGVVTPATFTTSPKTQEVGIVLTLTPQISESGDILLVVRPSITRVLSFINDPNPALAAANVTSPIPQLQTRVMESVLQLTSGQTAILGGLMQDNTNYARNAVPGLGNPANTGRSLSEIFGYRNDQVTKSEIVIFLRPTVITNPSLESDELKFYKRFLPQQTDTPTETIPNSTAGARR